MSLFGIGTDIVQVARMADNLGRYGERFAQRILADSELAEFRVAAFPARFLAKRFAAKEAAAKALGTGFRDGLTLRHFAVTHDASGKPLLVCLDHARRLMELNRVRGSHISISDERDYAVAFVVLEAGGLG